MTTDWYLIFCLGVVGFLLAVSAWALVSLVRQDSTRRLGVHVERNGRAVRR